MKVGIIIYSQTGNTLSVAERIKEKLLEKDCEVTIEKIEVEGTDQPRKNPYKLKTVPKVDKYDAIIFGSLVEAFSLSPVAKEYLEGITSLENKKVGCFVTQHLAYPWMGGNRAIKTMKKICRSKGANVKKWGIVNWSNKRREQMIEQLVIKISNL